MKKSFQLLSYILLFVVLGFVHLSQGQASDGIFSFWTTVWEDEQQMNFFLHTRLPRFVIGCLAGAALAIAGMLLQSMTKNPLASASTLGIHAGAYFFVVFCTIFFPSIAGSYPIALTMIGGIIAALTVTFLVGKSLDPVRIALTGLIITMLFSSFTAALQLLFENETSGLFLWGSGTLLQLDWSGVQFAWPWIITTIIIAIVLGRRFDLLLLGEETAIGLGQNVIISKILGWTIAITLASVTVTVVGPIGFIGIIAPHLVRLMGFHLHRSMIIANFITGAALLIGADILVRFVSLKSELPVGAMTAIIGGPWLVYLAFKMGRTTKTTAGVIDGEVRIQKLSRFILSVIAIVFALTVLSLSFGGTSFTSLIELPQELMHNRFVWDFRVPRTFVAILIGMMMGVSGLLMQTVLRNPLADASVLGVTSGASVCAMIAILAIPQAPHIFVPIGALVGGFVTMGIVLFFSAKSGYQPIILVLMGVAFSAVGSAIIQILIVRSNTYAGQALAWLAGSTYGTSWSDLILSLLPIAILFPIIVYYLHTFDILSFGDEVSIGLGVNASKMRLGMILLAVTLSSISVAIVGAIGFIGLLAPHIARQMVGPKMVRLLPATIFIGGILLISADFFGRFILAPKEVPAGMIISLIGAPYLLYLLKKTNQVKAK
ncbi:iron ABC transporter permease [Pseudogracilibacillus sp. SO30301A]|uniref:iron ABC transporter permease n=1 Tax=Pseudogracilibacillus sp. SO30301A TaxID=3098291 RepID=UPI00300E2581